MPVIRTGYDTVLARKTDDLFCSSAKEPGEIIDVNTNAVIFKGVSGKITSHEIGSRFGISGGLTTEHDIIANVKKGQKIELGDILTYNTGFFSEDPIHKGNVIMKAGVSATVCLSEIALTYEDSTLISQRLADPLTVRRTMVRSIVVPFTKHVHNLVELGSNIAARDPLCYVEDEVSASTGELSMESYDTLNKLSSKIPRAQRQGRVANIEIYYMGEIKDMSPSLAKIVKDSDKRLKDRFTNLGKKVYTGLVDGGYRIKGQQMAPDTAVIKIYITHSEPSGVSDKVILGHQMKTVSGGIMIDPWETESGRVLDIIQSANSIYNRYVLSIIIVGLATMLMEQVTQNVIEMYQAN